MGGTDLHVTTNSPPQIRVDGKLRPLDLPALTAVETKQLAYSVLTDAQKHRFEEDLELDFCFGIKGLARFRANVFMQRGAVGAVFRTIPYEIRGLQGAGAAPGARAVCDKPRGLVLVTGPTGSGKSTTLAAMIDKINRERHEHIVTVEDPIEYLHSHKSASSTSARWARGHAVVQQALTRRPARRTRTSCSSARCATSRPSRPRSRIAETGHLVFATLHTNSAAQTINRIIDVFPAHQQPQIRAQLSFVLEGVIVPEPAAQGRRPGPRAWPWRSWSPTPPSGT